MKTFRIIISIVLSALVLMPASVEAKKKQKVGIVAHRGFWNCEAAGYSQNSIASLKAAQDAGVWGSEFDVFLTADEQLVVNHDAVFQGLEIEKATYDQVRKLRLKNGEQIPNIDEYLEQGKKCP